jgi:hypothetical protein
MYKKALILSIMALALVIGTAGWANNTKAQTTTIGNKTIVDKLADKFKLNQNDIQSVFDEERQEKQKTRQVQMNAKLDQAVKDGVLTEDQKQKIIAKRESNQKERIKQRAEMQQWLKDNGIDAEKLHPYSGKFGKGMSKDCMHYYSKSF